MSDEQQGLDWWRADDGKWYPPEQHPDHRAPAPRPSPPTGPQWGMPQVPAPTSHDPRQQATFGGQRPQPSPGIRMTVEPRRRVSPLLIVLLALGIPALLALIAGVVVVAVGGITSPEEQAREVCAEELGAVQVAAAAYVLEYGEAPTTDEQLVPMYLTRPSSNYEIEVDAFSGGPRVVLQPGSPCPPPG